MRISGPDRSESGVSDLRSNDISGLDLGQVLGFGDDLAHGFIGIDDINGQDTEEITGFFIEDLELHASRDLVLRTDGDGGVILPGDIPDRSDYPIDGRGTGTDPRLALGDHGFVTPPDRGSTDSSVHLWIVVR